MSFGRFALCCLFIGLARHVCSSPMRAQTWTCVRNEAHGKAVALTTQARYSSTSAGWDLQLAPEAVEAGACSSSKSFFFSAPLPEGNYDVSVELGGGQASTTTVKAEARRPMLVRVATSPGQTRTEHFTVNIRRPEFGDQEVKRKPREMGSLDWDEKLTLEFAGEHPSLRRLTIQPAASKTPTIYLAGDSTVTDQDLEPWASWGQMLPAFFGPGVAIANHAESGETLRSFVGENRFPKIFSLLRRGDYLLMQFGHNDQKPGAGFVSPEQYAELLRTYIAKAREIGATPILLTPMNRRTFDPEGHIKDTLAPYPKVVREVAAEQKVALIDLNAMSMALYEAFPEGAEGTGPRASSLFVYAPAHTYPGQSEALHDDTHFNSYGAWELARCVVLGLQQNHVPLVKFLRHPHGTFDPHHPDAADSVGLPPTPFVDTSKPYER